MSVSKAVLRIRKEKGMTQGEVGRRAGLAASYVSRIENGRIQPTMTTLGRLAEALEVPVSSIFKISEKGTGPPLHRCPVSLSGQCIGEQIRSDHGKRPRGAKADYGKEELRLLRIADFLVLHGTKEVRGALSTVLESLLAHTKSNERGK